MFLNLFTNKNEPNMINTEALISYIKENGAENLYHNNEELCYFMIAQRMNSMKLNFDSVFRNRIDVDNIDRDYMYNIIFNKLKISNTDGKIDTFLNNVSDINNKIYLSPFRTHIESFGFSDETTQILEILRQEIKKNDETSFDFFDIIDKNKDKKITKNEFSLFFNFFKKKFTKSEIDKLFVRFDMDNDEIIDINEFMTTLGFYNNDQSLTQDVSLNDTELKSFLYDFQA